MIDPIIQHALIQVLQGNIPVTENPYQDIGKKLGISEDEVVEHLLALQQSGKLKRFGAILHHQKSGYSQNIMAAFSIPENQIDDLGQQLALSPLVSHCYQRQSYPEWPYNLYAMIHSREPGAIEAYVQKFAQDNAITEYQLLPSLEELKKTSMVFA